MASAITLICTICALFVVLVCVGFAKEDPRCIFSIFLFFLTIPAIIELTETPNDTDVIEGRAVYIETTHILNGDTTHTYKLKWKDKEDKK